MRALLLVLALAISGCGSLPVQHTRAPSLGGGSQQAADLARPLGPRLSPNGRNLGQTGIIGIALVVAILYWESQH